MASGITDLGLMDRSNARLVPDAHAGMTPGEAMTGMIRHGLGVAHRPRSLTPQVCANTPRDLLVRDGLRAELCNRVTLGRPRAEADADGGDRRVQELALAVWAHAGLDRRCTPRDTTSVALSGASSPERDAQALHRTHGSSKAHRPDVKPAVWELIVSPDGGGPVVRQSWEGHPADTQRFQERAQTLRHAVKPAPRPRSLMADAHLDTADNATNHRGRGFITRMAHTIGVVSHTIAHALRRDPWQAVDETTREQGVERCPEGLAQRGLAVSAQAARARAAATVTNATPRAAAAIATPLLHGHAPRCATPEAAPDALAR